MKIRCPHCSNPIEVIDESSFDDVECPSCGSSFNLAKDTETLSYRPAVGKTVAHFELFEHLGTGAFGTVWKARDTELDRTVAVKVPRKTSLSAEETEQFLREARAAPQVRHPNIVSVHEVGRTDSTVYIIADLVEGLTLTDWLSGQSLTPRESAELCLTIVNALHHAHECGIVHRDLKPSNIMLDQDGQPHVMDFGLAKREAGEITVTVEGQILGTPAYMSPEQARGDGHNVDRGSDIYSMGVILFEMLTNERPFRGSVRMLIYQVIYEEAPSPRQFNATVPKDLETICLKCLEKDPAKRFRTAEELGAEFQRFLNGEPILARPVSRIERSWRWSKRNPLIAALSAGLAVILLFLAIAGPVVYFREKTLRVDAVTAANDADRERGKAEGAKEDAEDARNEALEAQELAEVETERARNALASEAAARKASQEAESRAQLEVDKATLHAKAASLARNAVVVSRDSLRKNLYLSQMQSAHAALHDHDLQRVDRLLKNHIPEKDETDLRGFEWFYLRHSQHKAMHWLPYFGHFAVMSPDGSTFASSVRINDGYAIQLTNATTFLPEFQISLADLSFPNRVAFSPDGSRVFVGHHDSRISSWSLSEGKPLWENAGFDDQRYRITAIDCSPDGARIAAVNGATETGPNADVLVLDATTGEIVRRLPTGFGFANSVVFASNDRLVAGAAFGQTFCWNTESGEQIWQTSLDTSTHYSAGRDYYNSVCSIDISPDGSQFATGLRDGSVRLQDLNTGEILLQNPQQHRIIKH